MSSEIYEFDGCFLNSPLDDSSAMDILQQHNYSYSYSPLLPSPSFDEIATTLLSSSPPSHQLHNLSLYQIPPSNDFWPLEVKTEALYDHNYYHGGSLNALKMMQRSNSFQQQKSNPHGVAYNQPTLIDAAAPHLLISPHNTHIRRVCSTGDLQSEKVNETRQRLCSSPLATDMEDANFKVGRYNAEERKEKILRYKAKRTQRNFNKTIKYACRKTLADNRPRIRGRFARNDEPGPGEIRKATNFHQYGDEEELWMDGFHEDEDERMIGRPQFFNTYPSTTTSQFQQFSFIHN